jgi:hypothetical protein
MKNIEFKLDELDNHFTQKLNEKLDEIESHFGDYERLHTKVYIARTPELGTSTSRWHSVDVQGLSVDDLLSKDKDNSHRESDSPLTMSIHSDYDENTA